MNLTFLTKMKEIRYLCSEPNEMHMSEYAIHGNEQAVVERVAATLERRA